MFSILNAVQDDIILVRIFVDLGHVKTIWETEACVEKFPLERFGSMMKGMPKLRHLWWGVQVPTYTAHNTARMDTFHTSSNTPSWQQSFKQDVAAMCNITAVPIPHDVLVTTDLRCALIICLLYIVLTNYPISWPDVLLWT